MAKEDKKKLVGKVSHYYEKIGVAIVDLTGELKTGDEISIEGKTTSFRQKVESMQIEYKNIKKAKTGDSIGMKVIDTVRESDSVYKIVE